MATKLSTFNATAATATAASHYYVETADDGFIRPKTLANVKAEIVSTDTLGTGTANTSYFLRGDRTWSNNLAGPFSVGSVVPYAWDTAALTGAIDVSTGGVYGTGTQVQLTQNVYWNGTNWIYKRSLPASTYQQNNGVHVFYTAPTGTATAAATLTEKVRIDLNGVITQTNITSGAGAIVGEQTFRLAANGPATTQNVLADFFGTTSSISLEAASTYQITAYCVFLKTTAGTAIFNMLASSAPTRMVGTYLATPLTGIGSGNPQWGSAGSQGAISAAFTTTGSLTTAVNHVFQFTMQVQTNLATNFRLQLNTVTGTGTPLAGSYYTVKKISNTTGTFVA